MEQQSVQRSSQSSQNRQQHKEQQGCQMKLPQDLDTEYVVKLNEDERIDDLQIGGYRIIQDVQCFCFGVDAVLVADFAKVQKGENVIDLGTGTGIIPLLLAAKTQAKHIVGVELQSRMAQMAARSVSLNGAEERIDIIEGDLKDAPERFGKAVFDRVISNPPYIKGQGGLKNTTDAVTMSRHEVCCTLEDVVAVSAALLCPGGKLDIIHKPERMADALCLMRQYKLEPKRLRLVHPSPDKKPTMVLIEAIRGGRPHLNVDAPLYVHDQYGQYSAEINKIYGRMHHED